MNDRQNPQNLQNKLNTQQRCVNFVNHLDRIPVLAILYPVKSKVEEPNLPRRTIRVSDRKIIHCLKAALSGASLRNSARSLIERRAEPLGNLNKGHTERTLCGLPCDVSYGCTSMHQFGSDLFLTTQSPSNTTQRWSESLSQPGGGPSLAYSPYLPLERGSKWVVETKHKRSKRVCAQICSLIRATKKGGGAVTAVVTVALNCIAGQDR